MLEVIGDSWRDSYTTMIVELSMITPHPETRSQLFRFLRKETGRYLGEDSQRWMQWVWEQPQFPGTRLIR